MSFLKKLGAVVVGTASATAWLGAKAVEAGFDAMASKLGNNGSVTGSSGRTYTSGDYKDAAGKASKFASNDKGIVHKGFDKAKKLWNDK